MTTCIDRRVSRLGPARPSQALGFACALLLAACASTPPAHQAGAPQPAPTAPASAAVQQQFDAALSLMKEHQDQQAIAAFTQLTHDAPDASGPFTNLGILHARAKQWADAQQAFSAAVKLAPGNAVAWNWLGIAERNLGHYPQAATAYGKALAARPDYADAHFNLAVLYDTELHDAKRAISEYQAYQHTSGKDEPIVAAWIKGLQAAPAAAATPHTTMIDTP
ncbi:MAG: tetratricopeptide repeat protein [Nevskiaceae bacterium]|nr:MAG: tetratricopeptide repeat protein [Nevskiaceae bacterium]TBR74127.1 MAG: tetratricopeptide repeat protein [Nevskiaceae bacterium]